MAARGLRIELADIFRSHGEQYLATHPLARSQAKAWRAIIACRTEALGGHLEQCDACGVLRPMLNSCRDRHCPKCQMRAKEKWVAQRNRELLPVPYFHLVFTIPHDLNSLAGKHFRLITDILFACASRTLIEFGANPRWLGGSLAFSLVLHTWTQTLKRHLHVHALVAGGALTHEGKWVGVKPGFLFPVEAMSSVFREKFIAALQEARTAGKLGEINSSSNDAWRRLQIALRKHDWVVYAKQPLGGPSQVLEYLSRYTHRVAISNERLIGMKEGQVTFRVRDNARPGKTQVECLSADTFIGRFLLHVLPSGLKRIRHYGLLASCHKTEKLAACRAALGVPAPPVPDKTIIESVDAFMQRVAQIDITRCTGCKHGHFHVIGPIVPTHLQFPKRQATGPPP